MTTNGDDVWARGPLAQKLLHLALTIMLLAAVLMLIAALDRAHTAYLLLSLGMFALAGVYAVGLWFLGRHDGSRLPKPRGASG